MKDKKRISEMPGDYLLNNDGEVEYKIVNINEDDVNKMFLVAFGESWSYNYKNKVLLKMTDTGNGFKIGKKYIDLVLNADSEIGYDTAEYLRILLNYNNIKINSMPLNYNILLDTKVQI